MILACAGEGSEGSTAARVQEIFHDGVDGQRLLQVAQQHGLVPLLYRRLSTAVDLSQPALLEALRQQDEANARRALWLTLELLNIHKHLVARGLEVLPYKGPVLAHRLYGNVALRQFCDLDLLVHAPDLTRVKAALAELGYAPGLRLTPAAQRAYLRSGYEYTFDSPRGRNLVEIKWRILPQFYSISLDVDDFFERAVVVTVEGQNMRTLCDQDLMLVLCVHAAKHVWMQLSWLRDIVLLARSRALDWDALSAEAARLGIKRIVTVSFLLAQKLLGTPLPSLLRSHEDPAAGVLAQKTLQMIVADKQFDPESLSYFRLMMDLRERRRDRISFLWRLCVTPSAGEWSAIRLPGPLFPLYRVVRLIRLARRMVSPILGS